MLKYTYKITRDDWIILTAKPIKYIPNRSKIGPSQSSNMVFLLYVIPSSAVLYSGQACQMGAEVKCGLVLC